MIQARIGSSRFPKKVLKLIENRPMIWHVINRVNQIRNVQQKILLTTENKEDKVLLKIAKDSGIIGFSGNESDVLLRFYKCGLQYDADPIIRITGDCPLVDPSLVEEIVEFYLENNYDYVSNTLELSYPDGLDVEVFSFDTLKKMNTKAKLLSEREHVTPYIKNNIHKFNVFNFKNDADLSDQRWTVDEKRDLEFIKKIYAEMRPKKIFSKNEVLDIISKNPQILKINEGIKRNEGYRKSLQNDRIVK